MASENKSKAEIIAEHQANLPLPEDPPQPSDWNSADARTTAVGSGAIESDMSRGGEAASSGLRGPATGESAVRTDGDAFKTNVVGTNAGRIDGGIPSDAVTRDAKNAPGLSRTEN